MASCDRCKHYGNCGWQDNCINCSGFESKPDVKKAMACYSTEELMEEIARRTGKPLKYKGV